jgi:hypothetical protein
MPKIAGVNHLRAVQAFEKAGFKIVRHGKHIVMSDGSHFITIPRHKSGECPDDGRNRQRRRDVGGRIPSSALAGRFLKSLTGSPPFDIAICDEFGASPSPAVSFKIAICDLKAAASSAVSWIKEK